MKVLKNCCNRHWDLAQTRGLRAEPRRTAKITEGQELGESWWHHRPQALREELPEAFDRKPVGNGEVGKRLKKFSGGGSQKAKEFPDCVVRLEGMSQAELGLDAIGVTAALLFDDEISGFNQFPDDLLDHAFRDADHQCNFPQANLRVTIDAQEDVGVVGEERPRWDRA